MKFKLPSPVIKVLQTLERDKFEAFVVGGAVRDLLTHVPVTDWDFTTNATPEQIQKLFPDSFYDNRFGTVGVKFDEQVLEITTYRSESGYSDRRRPDRVKWGKTIAKDLTRRDFTVNAMALTDKLEIIDPFHGQKDLKQKIQSLYNNPSLCEKLGQRAKMTALKYDPEISYQKLLRIYRFAQEKK